MTVGAAFPRRCIATPECAFTGRTRRPGSSHREIDRGYAVLAEKPARNRMADDRCEGGRDTNVASSGRAPARR